MKVFPAFDKDIPVQLQQFNPRELTQITLKNELTSRGYTAQSFSYPIPKDYEFSLNKKLKEDIRINYANSGFDALLIVYPAENTTYQGVETGTGGLLLGMHNFLGAKSILLSWYAGLNIEDPATGEYLGRQMSHGLLELTKRIEWQRDWNQLSSTDKETVIVECKKMITDSLQTTVDKLLPNKN